MHFNHLRTEGDFESLHPHTEKVDSVRVSRERTSTGDAMGTHYRPAKLYMNGPKWHVEFWYRIPEELRPFHNNKKWKRFKKYEDINLHKNIDYAESLRARWQYALEHGYNPFKGKTGQLTFIKTKSKPTTIQQAIESFKAKWSERGLKPRSLDKVTRIAEQLLAYVKARNEQDEPTTLIDIDYLEEYLSWMAKDRAWSNRTYNNELTNLATMFIFFKDKLRIISALPTDGIDRKSVKSTKHRYYPKSLFEKLQKVLSKKDPYLYFACQCVYYLCIRSENELKNLKVSSIDFERKTVFITDGKTGERFIPMVDEMAKIFKERQIDKYKRGDYVFSVPHKNKFLPDGEPGPEPFGPNFFAKRFRKLRSEIGIGEDYTIYGLKHTRIVNLKMDGVSDADIMSLTGHRDFNAYSVYLRDLGLTVNPETINAKTRKF